MKFLKKLFSKSLESRAESPGLAMTVPEAGGEAALSPAISSSSSPLNSCVPVIICDPALAPCLMPGCRHFTRGLFCLIHTGLLPAWLIDQARICEENDAPTEYLISIGQAAGDEILDRMADCRRESLRPIAPRHRQPMVPGSWGIDKKWW